MSKKSKILIFLQFSIIAYFILTGGLVSKPILLLIQITAVFIALWGIYVMQLGKFNIQPEIKENANLIKKGPYKIIRNPMYLGIILFFGISIIDNFSFTRLVLFIVLTYVLLLKIFMEEIFLAKKFGETYLKYKSKTYRLFPFVF